ncbi:glycosyltransferase [Myxococcaceae bacterium GXIMD 01537]
MANIVIVPENLTGCINPTLGLARKLVQRGHRVTFMCRPDLEERIRRQGFEFAPMLEELYPKGSFEQEKRHEAEGGGFLKRIAGNARRRNELFRQGYFERVTRPLAPDLFIVDAALASHGVAAYATGVPVLMFYHQLTSVRDEAIPPLQTTLIPEDTARFRLRNQLAWRFTSLPRKLVAFYFDFNDDLRRTARELKVPEELIDFSGEFWPRLKLPELVFCPGSFDFPRERLPEGAQMVEPSVDFDRDDGDFPWDLIDASKPLINCSMGTLGVYIFAQESFQILQAVIDALGMRPQWQGVVTIGDQLDGSALRIPNNVIVRPYFPQLPLLQRASLSVIHGGLNTVKESILHEVPMVMLPLFNDQPGNAARVAYHGLGVIAGPPRKKRLTPQLVVEQMDRVMGDPGFKERVRKQSQHFWALEKDAPSVRIVEDMLGRGQRAVA